MRVVLTQILASRNSAAQLRVDRVSAGWMVANGVGGLRPASLATGRCTVAEEPVVRGCSVAKLDVAGLAMLFCATLAYGQGAPDEGVPDYADDPDGDEVIGSDDWCKTVPGPAANRGCPWSHEIVVVVGVDGATAINCQSVSNNHYCALYGALRRSQGYANPIFIDRNVYYGDGRGGDGGCDNIALNYDEQNTCRNTLIKLRLDAISRVADEAGRLSRDYMAAYCEAHPAECMTWKEMLDTLRPTP